MLLEGSTLAEYTAADASDKISQKQSGFADIWVRRKDDSEEDQENPSEPQYLQNGPQD